VEGAATMTTQQFIITLLELAAVAFVIWGAFNENKLIDFENKIAEVIRKK
jgi:hypothetical protein